MNIEREGLLMMELQKNQKNKKNMNGILKEKGCHEGKPK
jgi:hypothetical protein